MGEPITDDVSISSAEIAKILCNEEEQRIIFVALGVYDGGMANTEFQFLTPIETKVTISIHLIFVEVVLSSIISPKKLLQYR